MRSVHFPLVVILEEGVMGQREVPEVARDPGELGELVTERLEAEITPLAAHLTAAECRFLMLVGEFDRREAFLAWGCRTAAFWLSWKCGLDIRSAQEKLRVARKLAGCPHVVEAFAAGRLSYSKVRAITRIVTPRPRRHLAVVVRRPQLRQLRHAHRPPTRQPLPTRTPHRHTHLRPPDS